MKTKVKMVETERELLNDLRCAARKGLGPEASEEQVEAAALRAYNGPVQHHQAPETPAQRQERERVERRTTELIKEWNRD